MQSAAKAVTTYIEEAPAERRETLLKLHALCQEFLPGFEEGNGIRRALLQAERCL